MIFRLPRSWHVDAAIFLFAGESHNRRQKREVYVIPDISKSTSLTEKIIFNSYTAGPVAFPSVRL